MTDVVNPKSASPDQLLPYHKKISAEGKALMKCFISYTYMVLKGPNFYSQAHGELRAMLARSKGNSPPFRFTTENAARSLYLGGACPVK